MGRRQGNLYALDKSTFLSPSISSSCNSISIPMSKTKLWHYHLKNYLNINDVLNVPGHCSICNLAKQRRLPFISTNSMFDSRFDLIHCDI